MHRQVQNSVHQEVHPSTLSPGAALAPLSRHRHAAPTPPSHCSNAAPTQQQLALTPPALRYLAAPIQPSRRSHVAPTLPCCSNAAAMLLQRRPHAALTPPSRRCSLSPGPPPPFHLGLTHCGCHCPHAAATPPSRSCTPHSRRYVQSSRRRRASLTPLHAAARSGRLYNVCTARKGVRVCGVKNALRTAGDWKSWRKRGGLEKIHMSWRKMKKC